MANLFDMEGTITNMDSLRATHETLQLAKAGDGLKALRQVAFEKFSETGFPTRKFEEYKYSPFQPLIEKSVDFLKTSAIASPGDDIKSQFWSGEGSHLVFFNGKLSQEHSRLDQSIELGTIAEDRLASAIEKAHDPFSCLNLAFCEGGTAIALSSHTSEATVFIYNVFELSAGQVIAQPLLDVSVKSSGSIKVIEKNIFRGEGDLFYNTQLLGDVAANGQLNWTKTQDYHANHIVVDTVNISQEKDSRSYVNTLSFSGKLVRNNLNIVQEDEHCESHMQGLYLLNGKTHVDNHTAVDHKFPNSYSDELYKGIVDERSRAVFNGKIYVRPGAQKTNAFQSNNNISLSDSAIVNTKPQLEIWADDVKCSHGCTIGQLDEEAIFYLRARGLDEQSAKAMMLIAFAEDTLKNIPLEEVKADISQRIVERLTV